MAFDFAKALGNVAVNTGAGLARKALRGSFQNQIPNRNNLTADQKSYTNQLSKTLDSNLSKLFPDNGGQRRNDLRNQMQDRVSINNNWQSHYQDKADSLREELKSVDSQIANYHPTSEQTWGDSSDEKDAIYRSMGYNPNAYYIQEQEKINPYLGTQDLRRRKNSLNNQINYYDSLANSMPGDVTELKPVSGTANVLAWTDVNGKPMKAAKGGFDNSPENGVSKENLKAAQDVNSSAKYDENDNRIYTINGEEIGTDDTAFNEVDLAWAHYFANNPELQAIYGDDVDRFLREATKEQAYDTLMSEEMNPYYQYILNDEAFWTDGKFDMDKYWAWTRGLNPYDMASMDAKQRAAILGDNTAVTRGINQDVAKYYAYGSDPDRVKNVFNTVGSVSDSLGLTSGMTGYGDYIQPYMFGMKLDPNSSMSDAAAKYFSDNVSYDYNDTPYLTGLSEEQYQNLLDQMAIQYMLMDNMGQTASGFTARNGLGLEDLNWLADKDNGWGIDYSFEPAKGYTNDYGLGTALDLPSYDPYYGSGDWLYNVFEPTVTTPEFTGAVTNEYFDDKPIYYGLRK